MANCDFLGNKFEGKTVEISPQPGKTALLWTFSLGTQDRDFVPRGKHMSTPLWIGFGFLMLLVIFLICSFFFAPKLTDDQRGTLKFLSALCAGFSGGFLTGGALFEAHKTAGTTTFGISGTAGCALFLVVWFFYPRVFRLNDGFEFSIPAAWKFRDTVDGMTKSTGSVSEMLGFTTQELNAPIRSRTISAKSLSEAILQLRLITIEPDAICPYDVTQQASVYRLTARRGGVQ